MSTEAQSFREQADIEALLLSMQELSTIAVATEYKGTTEAQINALLGGSAVPAGKTAGLMILVCEPEESGDEKAVIPLMKRQHFIRIWESERNWLPRLSGEAQRYSAGMNADYAKDLVIQRLIVRPVAGGVLMFTAVKPIATDGKRGREVTFTVKADLATEARAAVMVTSATVRGATATAALLVIDFTGAGDAAVGVELDGGSQFSGPGSAGNPPLLMPSATGWSGSVTAPGIYTYVADDLGENGHTASATGTLIIAEFTPGTDAGADFPQVTIVGNGSPGEAFLYTTDGTPPVPGGATVQTYSAPFTAARGTLIRAAATATGKALSNFFHLTIP